MKRLFVAAAFMCAGPANSATTYVVLPSPGAMAQARIYVDTSTSSDRTLICKSMEQIATRQCRPHSSRISAASDCEPGLLARLKSVAIG